MEIRLASDVIADAKPELWVVLGWVKRRWEELGLGEFTIVAIKNGEHKEGSQHHQDDDQPSEAADIRTRHHFDYAAQLHYPAIITLAKELQAQGLHVIVHPDWMQGPPHLHLGLSKPVFVRV